MTYRRTPPPCKICGQTVSRNKMNRNIYCSLDCYRIAQRERLSDRIFTCVICGNQAAAISRYAAQRRKYCSRECAGVGRRTDIQHLNKIIREHSTIAAWSKAVQERDGHACQDCGNTDDLHSHHIETVYSLLRRMLDPENGVTVCIGCHVKRHEGQFGRSRNQVPQPQPSV